MKDIVRKVLSQRRKKTITDDSLRPSGVLLPLFYKDGKYHILLTRRTENLEHHKGQISFPGGAYDEGDRTLMVTALREAYEEIGLKSEDVEILGELDDMVTTTEFIISPFVGFIPYPYEFNINTYEIAELIEVPVQALLDREEYREDFMTREGTPYHGYSYEYNGHIVWGATARILKQFLDLVFKR